MRKKTTAPEGFEYVGNLDSVWGEEKGASVIVLSKYRVRNPTQIAYPYKLLRIRPKEGDRVKIIARNKRTNNELTFTADVGILKSNPNYGYLNFRKSDEIQKGDTLFILQIRYIKGKKFELPANPNKKIDLG